MACRCGHSQDDHDYAGCLVFACSCRKYREVVASDRRPEAEVTEEDEEP